jgi:CHAT domain-containing protein/tetratricopeptide (TPR) repeat protein
MKTVFLVAFLAWSIAGFSQNIPEIYKQLESNYEGNNFEACLKLEQEILKLDLSKVDTISANSLFYLGDSYNQLGNIEKALLYFEQEKPMRKQLGNSKYYGISLFNLAYVYLQSGNYVKAGEIADELLDVDRAANGPASPQFASSVINVADIYLELDRTKDAEKVIQATLRQQPRNTVAQGLLLSKLGDVYTYTGQFSKAAAVLQEAVDLLFLHAGEESSEYITAAVTLGVLYMKQGKYPEAEEIFEVALNLMPEDEPDYPTVLNNQALVYQYLGSIDRSEVLFRKIKTMDSVAIGTSHPDYAITLSNMGLVLMEAGKYDPAEKAMLQALAIQKKSNEANTVSYARKLNNLGRIYQASGKAEKAIPNFEKSAGIYKKALGENHHEYATVMYNLANAYWRAGKNANALKYLRTSASIRAKTLGKKHPKYAQAIQKIAEYQWEQKQVKEAQQTFSEVFENFHHQIDVTFPGLTEEEKTKFYYSNIKDSFEKFNSFAVQNSKEHPQLIGDLYNHHINTKGAIMYATEKVRKAIMASKDSVLIKLFEEWHDQKEQIARSYSQNQDISKLDSLVQSANLIEKELTRRSMPFSNQFNRKKLTWQDVQKVLKPGEGSIEVLRFKVYSPVNSGSFTSSIAYAFVLITPEMKSPELLVFNNGGDLETKFLKFYQNSIKFNLEDPYSYKNYFEPIADLLKKHNISKIYFSPDGVYNQINLNGIQNPFTKKYLLEEYDVTFITNSKELVDRNIKVAKNDPVLIGFPKFNLQKTSGSTSEAKITRSGNLTRGMRGLLRFMRGEEGITELPGTQKEIQEISTLFKQKPEIYMEHQATEDVTKKVDNPGYLHIATHGYFLEDEISDGTNNDYITNPLLKAGLILAGSENFILNGIPVNEAGDDGILTAYEAMNLKLDDTKLVVLSACETGLGQVKNGEGVYGLQRAFKLAGAQSIVMSLWSVDDAATQELMSTFYSELLKTGDQHSAFRYAQQKIKDKYQKPFYWAAFVMVGI